MWVFRFLRNTAVLAVLCVSLLISTATLAFQTVALGAQLTAATASGARAAAQAVARSRTDAAVAQRRAVARAKADAAVERRKAVSKAVARTRAKARLRRLAVAVPFAGAGAFAYFEARDYIEWQKENPGKTLADYGCEMAALSAEVMDEFLQELPEATRFQPALFSRQVEGCGQPPL